MKTDPLAAKFGQRFNSVHSEIDALKALGREIVNLSKYTIINVRVSRSNELVLAAPCQPCLKLLNFFGAKEIWYSDNGLFLNVRGLLNSGAKNSKSRAT